MIITNYVSLNDLGRSLGLHNGCSFMCLHSSWQLPRSLPFMPSDTLSLRNICQNFSFFGKYCLASHSNDLIEEAVSVEHYQMALFSCHTLCPASLLVD